MEKMESSECLMVSCVDRNQNIVRCCFDSEKIRMESDIRTSIGMAAGLNDFMSGSIILK